MKTLFIVNNLIKLFQNHHQITLFYEAINIPNKLYISRILKLDLNFIRRFQKVHNIKKNDHLHNILILIFFNFSILIIRK